jgi:hypothetical protein
VKNDAPAVYSPTITARRKLVNVLFSIKITGVPMPAQAAPQDPSAEEQMRRLRLRKVYIQLRIPRVKAEIAAVATRKKAMNESGSEASKELIEERIYSNQHLVALRKELQALEQERKTVLSGLREIRLEETGKAVRATSR